MASLKLLFLVNLLLELPTRMTRPKESDTRIKLHSVRMSKLRGASYRFVSKPPWHLAYKPRSVNAHIDHSNSSVVDDAGNSTLAPSQWLRYALNGDPEIDPTTERHTTQVLLDQRVELVLSKRNFQKKNMRRAHILSVPGAGVPWNLADARDLCELQLWFERWVAVQFRTSFDSNDSLRHALFACQKSSSSLEILSVLTALMLRIKKASFPMPRVLREAALYHAFQSLHLPAIRYHLQSNNHVRPGGCATKEVMNCLLQAIRTARFTNPAYDTSPLLEVVAGNESDLSSSEATLMSVGQFNSGNHTCLIELLCELKSNTNKVEAACRPCLNLLSTTQQYKARVSATNQAYEMVGLLYKYDMTDLATSALKEISEKVPNIEPSIKVSSRLAALLDKKGLQVPPAIEARIQKAMCDALNKTSSTSSNQDFPNADQHNAAFDDEVHMDEDVLDLPTIRSLLDYISSHGTSLSASDIAVVIDALNECTGTTVPLFTFSTDEHGDYEYAWCPQWIPAVSGSALFSFSQTSQTLGLLRAKIMSRGIVYDEERARNLIQLGHLVRRKSKLIQLIRTDQGDAMSEYSSHGNSIPGSNRDFDEDYGRFGDVIQQDEFQEDINQGHQTDTWTTTGYLVVFDRLSAEYLLLYMGEGIKILDPDYKYPTQTTKWIGFSEHEHIGSLSHIDMPKRARDLDRDIGDVLTPVKDAADRYVFEIDAGDILQP